MTAHEIHALSGAYAVDALDDLERARFEEHLAACAECRAEVASLQSATLLLSELSETAPPAELRAKILDDIKTVRPLPPVVARIEARRPRRWSGLVAAAAAAAVFVGGGTFAWQQATDDRPTISAADQVIASADVKRVDVDLPGEATASVYRSVALGKAALVTSRMPAPPSGRVYQLWLQKAGRMVPAGLMPSGSDQKLVIDGSADDATAVGITVEPDGGSAHPTSPPIAVFAFEQAT
jgi:anti-sigma-K factor RskA